MAVEVPLTKGYVALVDDEDAERVIAAGPWFVMEQCRGELARRYAIRRSGKRTVYMHRLIMDAPAGMEVDHVNGDGLDNRRENLRLCTRAENRRNQRKAAGLSSRFKGVDWHKGRHRWRAQIEQDRRARYLGHFNDEADAARAYDKAARELFGEFANLNFPEAAQVQEKRPSS